MNNNENPVYTRGDKNVLCPYYGNCLDYAVKLQWEYWTCLHCQHRQKEIFVEDALSLTRTSDPFYSFSSFCHKKLANMNRDAWSQLE